MPAIKPTRGTKLNPAHPISRGLVACWLMNEGTGDNVFDFSGNSNNGTLHGPPAWSAGKTGNSLEFVNGNSEYVDFGDSRFQLDKTNKLSIVAIAFRNSAGPTYSTVIHRGNYVFPFSMTLYTAGSYVRGAFAVRTTGGNTNLFASTAESVLLGQYGHFAGTYDGSVQKIYQNGVLENQTSKSGDLNFDTTSHPTYIGASEGWESDNLDGGVCHVFLWNRALSESEIKSLYREPYAMFEPGLSPALVTAQTDVISLAGSVNAQSVLSALLSSVQKVDGIITGTSNAGGSIHLIPFTQAIDLGWLCDVLFNGTTANAFKLGTTMSLGWFWMHVTGCSALYRGPSVDEIDFTNILTVVNIDAAQISPPCYCPHDNNSTYFYIVRRFNHIGYQEQTLRAAVKVTIDHNGELAKPRPNNIYAAKIEKTENNKVQLIWFYCPIEQESQPKQFNIYYDNRTGQIDYENPIATIDYQERKFYSFLYEISEPGKYLFAVRAEDIEATENNSSVKLSIQISNTNPNPIEILDTKGV